MLCGAERNWTFSAMLKGTSHSLIYCEHAAFLGDYFSASGFTVAFSQNLIIVIYIIIYCYIFFQASFNRHFWLLFFCFHFAANCLYFGNLPVGHKKKPSQPCAFNLPRQLAPFTQTSMEPLPLKLLYRTVRRNRGTDSPALNRMWKSVWYFLTTNWNADIVMQVVFYLMCIWWLE